MGRAQQVIIVAINGHAQHGAAMTMSFNFSNTSPLLWHISAYFRSVLAVFLPAKVPLQWQQVATIVITVAIFELLLLGRTIISDYMICQIWNVYALLIGWKSVQLLLQKVCNYCSKKCAIWKYSLWLLNKPTGLFPEKFFRVVRMVC